MRFNGMTAVVTAGGRGSAVFGADPHSKEDASIAVVMRNVDDANAEVTKVEKESSKGICEKARCMSLLLGQD